MSVQPFQIFNNVTNEILYPVLNVADVTQTKTKTFQIPKFDINQLADMYDSSKLKSDTLEYDKYKLTTDFEDFLDIFSEAQKTHKPQTTQQFTLSLSPEFKLKNIDQLANDYSQALVPFSPSQNPENFENSVHPQNFTLSLSRTNAINTSLALLNSPSVNLNKPERILKNYIQYFFGTVKNFKRFIFETQSGFLVQTKSSLFFNPFQLFTLSNNAQLKITDDTLSSIQSITTLIPPEIFVEN
jgi:hypothetical protein